MNTFTKQARKRQNEREGRQIRKWKEREMGEKYMNSISSLFHQGQSGQSGQFS
jgi:hypothetical protein